MAAGIRPSRRKRATIVNLRKVGDLAEEWSTPFSPTIGENLGAAASTARVPGAVRDALSRCLTPVSKRESGCDRFVLAAAPEPVQRGDSSDMG